MCLWLVDENFDAETLKMLRDCDNISEGKEIIGLKEVCQKDYEPGKSWNDHRKLWCNNDEYYKKVVECWKYKVNGMPASRVQILNLLEIF